MKQRKGTRDLGHQYECKVITLLATILSQQENVENYSIHSNVDEIPGFDDAVIKIKYKNDERQPVCLFVQIKHRAKVVDFFGHNKQDKSLDCYKRNIKQIIDRKNEISILDDVRDENMQFWFYTNNFFKGEIEVNEEKICLTDATIECDSLLNFKGCRKLKDEYKQYCPKNFYFYLNQSSNMKIHYDIKNLFTHLSNADTEEIIRFVDKFFSRSTNGDNEMTKTTFEMELLRIQLSISVKPTVAIDINPDMDKFWHELTQYKVYIVEDFENIESFLFGWFIQCVDDIYKCNFQWNNCIADNGILERYLDVKTILDESKRNKYIQHWLTPPDTLESLLLEMWKHDDLPLILKPTKDPLNSCKYPYLEKQLSVLCKYLHLNKRFIIIGDDETVRKVLYIYKDDICPKHLVPFTKTNFLLTQEVKNHSEQKS